MSHLYQKLERTDLDTAEEIETQQSSSDIYPDFSANDYRIVLIKNLKYIESLRLATVDWPRVERTFPSAQLVAVDLDADTNDSSFFKLLDNSCGNLLSMYP